MIKNPITAAFGIAAHVHSFQTDKADEEYLLHCMEVFRMVRKSHPENIEAQVVAILHDVLEDFRGSKINKMQLEQKIGESFGERVFFALLAISHDPSGEESYDDYIERIARNFLARIVKIKDLTHNMDPRRIPAYQIVDKDFARWDKYRRALIRLEREDA